MFGVTWQELLLRLPVVLMAITIHEYAHGYAAYKMGDPTAKFQGRLSMNPLAHMDLLGALCMILFRFGWAKPVPINPNNFRNRKKGTVIVSLAGPLSNLFLALVGAVVCGVLLRVGTYVEGGMFMYALQLIFTQMLVINISFAVFNIIPVPPLDGSKILGAILPSKYYFRFMQYERYGFIILLVLIYTGILNGILGFLINPILDSMLKIIYIIGGI